MKRLILIVLVCLAAVRAYSATGVNLPAEDGEYLVDVWRSEDGLPQNSITSIAQTPDGYLWLATFNGLVRFDGMRFTVFDAVNTPELRSSRMVRLCTDRQGRLWSSSQEGDVTMLAQGVFTHAESNLGLPAGKIGLRGPDPNGDIWVRAELDGTVFRMEDGRFVPARSCPGGALTNLDGLATDTLGDLWMAGGGEWRALTNFDAPSIVGPDGASKLRVWMAGKARDGGIWILSSDGLRGLHGGKWGKLMACPFGEGTETCLQEDHDGNIWVGSWSAGLRRFGVDGTLRRLDLSQSPQPMAVRALYEDAEGNLWIGLDGGGLCRMRRRVFQTYGVAEGLRGYLTRSAVEDSSGTIWVLDTGYLDWLSPNRQPLIEKSGFELGTAWCALPGENGEVWVASRAGKVFRCRRDGIEPWPVTRHAQNCAVLFTSRDGTLWMGAENGLWRREGQEFQSVPLPATVAIGDVRAITEDKVGQLYVGLNGGGLLRYRNGDWTRLGTEEGSQIQRPWALYADADDTIWIGGFGKGLSRLRNGKLFHFDDSGLGVPRVIASIIEDNSGYLWFGSNQGIFRVSRRELNEYAAGTRTSVSSVQFGRSDGLETTECAAGSQPVAWKARDGRIWFSTVRGVSVVNPEDLQLNTHPPPVAIEEIAADDNIYSQYRSGPGSREAKYDRKKNLLIPAGTDRIEFHFTALTFSAPAKARFRYQLENFDQDWAGADTRRTATYTHVPPGTYRFHVIACNNDGIWNEIGAMQAIVVLPRYYQTWLFKLALAGIAMGLIWLAYHVRLRQLQELNQLRMRIASDLHDEVGSNLGSIALNSEMLQGSPDLSEDDRRELGEIKRVAFQTTQTIREITWLINPGFDTLPEMTGRMKIVAASMLTGRAYEFIAPEGMAPRKLSLEFRRHVFLIFKEILHNIVKHSGAARVEIRLGENAGRFELFVRDDGRGFDESSIRHGHGLGSLRRRAEALGGVMEVKSQPGHGTTIYLTARIK